EEDPQTGEALRSAEDGQGRVEPSLQAGLGDYSGQNGDRASQSAVGPLRVVPCAENEAGRQSAVFQHWSNRMRCASQCLGPSSTLSGAARKG
ncbi:MAG: hypothetical protein KAG62_14160, partial [Caulobacter sp.]|nr:hypothetical protein [Caulobacter sp.]